VFHPWRNPEFVFRNLIRGQRTTGPSFNFVRIRSSANDNKDFKKSDREGIVRKGFGVESRIVGRQIAVPQHQRRSTMARISHRPIRVVKQLLICGGLIALLSISPSSSGVGVNEAPTNLQNPSDQLLQAPPKLQFEREFQSAPELFRLGRFAEAERQFAWIAAVRRGTSWGERGQYYLAECQYLQKKYVAALKNFERLHTEYPMTDYRDKLVNREYEIAQLWLAQADPGIPAEKKLPGIARVDGRLPLFGTRTWALHALERVRFNDPTGPLADDATIQIADYYMRRREFDIAALYYAQFVIEFPKSPLLLYARISAIHARIRDYLEP
jgi:hypothetical protein